MYSYSYYEMDNKIITLFMTLFVLIGILFINCIGFITDFINFNSTYNEKIESNISEYIPTSNGKYKKVYYFSVGGKEYSCVDDIYSNSGNNDSEDSMTLYYNRDYPDVCTTGVVNESNINLLISVPFFLIPIVILMVFFVRIKRKMKKIKKLSKCGKLVKNLKYLTIDLNVDKTELDSKAGVNYKIRSAKNKGYIVVAKYKINNQEHTFYSDKIYDKKLFKEYSTIDLLINENDVNDYFLDFNIQIE